MSTAQNLIDASLRKLGVVASGASGTAGESADGLEELNRMLGTWNTQRLLSFAEFIETLTMISGTQFHTIGPGGNFNTIRPERINHANLLNAGGTAILNSIAVRDAAWWASYRPTTAVSGQPVNLFYNPQYPSTARGIIFFDPTPDAAYQIELFSWGLLTSIASLATTVTLPPGYEDLIVSHLCIRLAPEYGKAVPQEIRVMAAETMAAIKTHNSTSALLTSDYPGVAGGAYDIRSGNYR